MQNQASTLSESQQNALDNIKYPAGWTEPNPPLLPSPYPWSGSYTSPAWLGSLNQSGGGSFIPSNQFNSAISQPLGMHIDWLGRDDKVGTRLVNQQGGMVEPSDNWWDGYTSKMKLLGKNKMPSQKFGYGMKKNKSRRK